MESVGFVLEERAEILQRGEVGKTPSETAKLARELFENL